MKVELYKNLIIDNLPISREAPNSTIKVEKPANTAENLLSKDRKEPLKELTEELNNFLESFNLQAKLVYNRDYETMVVQISRIDTGELIKQIPPEELLEVSKRIQELVGILLRDKA